MAVPTIALKERSLIKIRSYFAIGFEGQPSQSTYKSSINQKILKMAVPTIALKERRLVEVNGFEPLTLRLQSGCSTN